MDDPTGEVAVNTEQINSEENHPPRNSGAAVECANTNSFNFPSQDRRRHRRHRRQRRHHRNYHGVRSGQVRYEKTLLHFSAAHILLGIVCVLLQMVQFTNHSILSEAQPGLWCGTFFVITGSVCLGLTKTKGLYSTVTMLCFCLVSLFMALTLASLSWFGAEAAACCQDYWDYNCETVGSVPPILNSTRYPAFATADEHQTTIGLVTFTSSAVNSTNSCYGTIENGPSCENVKRGYCGYDIGLGRTLHLLLLLAGVIGATTSFVLSTLACSRPNREAERSRPRLSSIFVIGGDHLPTGGRPITAWEFPPPVKDHDLARSAGVEEQYPEEPPPPYVEQDNDELQCHL
ncbi:uncharacterized protein LOC116924932 [Daphnia magna]|uniref:Uncharacterized protein n=2 Tax=Daphnia magna TaxID=35525 RepID=A0A164THS1_9CRUS|nr:uncharacterized protein LOC116924932 [Daphnia magna]XP_045031295.1 uncharacterized protein LOC116924932 [Daphnia magna]KAK4017419.1 hypothetical protein OUZ56_032730 [Daphnia magna]KZS10469.1 Uncharacterized protein APZ42_025067 [Daphnia magna]